MIHEVKSEPHYMADEPKSNLIYLSKRGSLARNWIICDLDGTLTDYGHRRHFLMDPNDQPLVENHDRKGPDWDNFNRAAALDPIKKDINLIINMASQATYGVCIMTGRSNKFSFITVAWLTEHNIACDMLLMRNEKDFRSDTIVKSELYRDHFTIMNRKVHFVLEDRDKVVEMWRGLGLTCLQVCEGEY